MIIVSFDGVGGALAGVVGVRDGVVGGGGGGEAGDVVRVIGVVFLCCLVRGCACEREWMS